MVWLKIRKITAYDWKFCTIGGVRRVKIASGQDIAHLDELDQKLWTVLSCPIVGLEFDEKTIALMDTNKDGKICVNEVKAAAKWLTSFLKDKALEDESAVIDSVEKFLRYYKNFYKLLKNFVTFTDFYARDPENKAVFQAGILFIDQRSTELCIKVADMGKQGEVSELSGIYVLYCDCTSQVKNTKMTIAAVLTDGDVDDLRVGKNAMFYDHEGHDWDAVITKIIDNPISIRQAFWSPYRKLGRFVYDKMNKAASEKSAKAEGDLLAKADNTNLTAPKEAPAADAAPADAAPAPEG